MGEREKPASTGPTLAGGDEEDVDESESGRGDAPIPGPFFSQHSLTSCPPTTPIPTSRPISPSSGVSLASSSQTLRGLTRRALLADTLSISMPGLTSSTGIVNVPDWREDDDEREVRRGGGAGGESWASASLTTTQSPPGPSWACSAAPCAGPSPAAGAGVVVSFSSSRGGGGAIVEAQGAVEGESGMVGGHRWFWWLVEPALRHARRLREAG